MRISRVISFCVLWVVCVASPIIRVKTINGQKKTYCCYGVVKPFDMNAKAKQGLRALHRLGLDLNKLREVVGLQQKTLEGKLAGAKKKAEDISKRAKDALRATKEILSEAVKKAARKLGEVEGLSNDLGDLSKQLGSTKTTKAIRTIRRLIADKPLKKTVKNIKHAKKCNTVECKKERNSIKDKDKLRPKDRIPGQDHLAAVAQNILNNEETHEEEEVRRVRDMIEAKTQNYRRKVDEAKNFLKQVKDGMQQVESVMESG